MVPVSIPLKRPYPEVVDLILRFSHRHKLDNVSFPELVSQGKTELGAKYVYQSPDNYNLSVTIGVDRVIIDGIGDLPHTEKMLGYLEKNIRKDQMQLTNLLLDNIDKVYPDEEACYSYIRDSFVEVFERFINKFELRDRLNSKETLGNRELTRCSIVFDGGKITFTSYTKGTIMTQGLNNGYQEEFWKLLLDMRKEKTKETP